MEDYNLAIALLFLTALGLFILFSVCQWIGFWTWVINWISSSREEKANLTRTEGHYNANGYLVPAESTVDINLCHSGSFKRFETVDHDFSFEMSDFTSEPTPQQPPEQLHNYPQDVYLPYGKIEASDDPPVDYTAATYWESACDNDLASEFISSTPFHRQPSTAFIQYPPQPLRLAPSPSYSTMIIHEKYESEKPEKVKFPPKRPPLPVVSQHVSSTVKNKVASSKVKNKAASPPVMNKPASRPPLKKISTSKALSKIASSSVTKKIPTSPIMSHPPPLPNWNEAIIHHSFGRIVPPPIPPRIRPPPLPPRRLPSEESFEKDDSLAQLQGLQRGISFESINSDTSVVLADLDGPHVTGYLCVALDYLPAIYGLCVTILEARELRGLEYDGHTILDTFVRVHVLDKTSSLQSRICRKSNSPSFKDRFLFFVTPQEFSHQILSFYLYSAEVNECILVGEGGIHLSDVSITQSVTTWITLTDTGQFRTEWGEIMLSLNYLPTAERLTVGVIKAKNLAFPNDKEGDSVVKVYLLKQGKKAYKKKTTTKHGERDPVYNEAMIFSIPPSTLQHLQLRVTVADCSGGQKPVAIGHVIMGTQATGKTYSHWIQMLMSPRRPISMWHSLARR